MIPVKNLIISADDYGMSPAVNRAIEQTIEAGLVTSTNIMMNMGFCDEAVRLKDSGASLGLHWVLSCGKPTLTRKQIPSLVAEDGDFYPYPKFRERYRKGLIRNEDIERELTEQYRQYFELMGAPDYWNSHENVHIDFKIYALFVDIAARLGIKKMRSHQRIHVPGSTNRSDRPTIWRIAEPVKSLMLDCWQNNAHKKGIASPDGMLVLIDRKDSGNPEYIFQHIQWGKRRVAEFVIHPAVACDSPYFGEIVDRRIREYRLFTSDSIKKVLDDAGIQLVNYDVL